jgi:[ribosomal protein S5]-alanine N-acetyltransferase
MGNPETDTRRGPALPVPFVFLLRHSCFAFGGAAQQKEAAMRSEILNIETERLALRAYSPDDATNLSRLAGDFDVAKMTSSVPHPYPRLSAEGYIMLAEAARPLGKDMPFAIELPGQGLIGAAGFHARGADKWEFGYWIGKPFWGKGFATEAARALLAWWDESRKVGCLSAARFIDNPASGRVLEKIGFKLTGEMRELYSLARLARIPSLDYVRCANSNAQDVWVAAE